MSGRIIPIVLEEGQGFPGIEPLCTCFAHLLLELSGYLWVCHLDANVLLWAYDEAQGPLEVEYSTILDQVSSNQFYVILILKEGTLLSSLLFHLATTLCAFSFPPLIVVLFASKRYRCNV